MHTLHLYPTEHQVLIETLENNLRELDHEIAHTDSKDFRDSLRGRAHTLESILNSLRSQPDLESEAVYPPSI